MKLASVLPLLSLGVFLSFRASAQTAPMAGAPPVMAPPMGPVSTMAFPPTQIPSGNDRVFGLTGPVSAKAHQLLKKALNSATRERLQDAINSTSQ